MGHLEAARYPMAENGGARSLIDHFAVLADPRQSWKVVYPHHLGSVTSQMGEANPIVTWRQLGCKRRI